jgi:Bacteriophage HK97-gp10, putative tail-component
MARYTIVINQAAMAEFQRDPNGEIGQTVLEEAGQIVARGARIRVPIDTGRLYDSIGYERGADEAGIFVKIYAQWYDRFLEKPAKQMRHAHRSLRSAVRDLPSIIAG